MKMKIILSVVAGIATGILLHRTWQARTSTAHHWRAVESYVAYMRDSSDAKPDPQTGLSYMTPPMDDPEPHLAALVAEGELQHLDIVLPTVPYTNRAATRHWMAFCERHPEDIVYAYGNPSAVAFPTKGNQPTHLNIWFPELSESVVQQLISELEAMGTVEEPIGWPVTDPAGQPGSRTTATPVRTGRHPDEQPPSTRRPTGLPAVSRPS